MIDLRRALLALSLAAIGAGASAQAASADNCRTPVAYPGDTAPSEAIARWMAPGARARGIPGELPVMGALVESDLHNLNYGDADAVGYFAMRLAIWNTGPYAGFPDNPDLQLTWFIDQALSARARRVAAGDAGFGLDPSTWGEWVADVEQPASQFRYRYQLRLEQARGLIGPDCAGFPQAEGPPPPTPPATLPPLTEPPPSNDFSVRTGHAGGATVIVVVVPGPGTVTARQASPRPRAAAGALVKPARAVAARAGRVRLRIRPTRAGRRALRRKRSIAVRMKLTYTPTGGAAHSTFKRVRVKRGR
jgi:hypothetical protein